MTKNYEKLVSDHWSQMAKQQTGLFHWSDSSIVMQNINKCISGNPNMGWFQYVCEKYILKDSKGVNCGLSIGCGSGALERHCRLINACQTIDAIDLAEGAIEEAKKLAQEKKISGINYTVQNIENINLPKEKYDVVFASSAIHHVKNLEALFDQVRSSLKPFGLFIMLEYVGPSQFQFTKKSCDLINELLSIFPKEYRKISSDPTKTKDHFTKATIEMMNASDPSEAIRSAEITPLLSKYFTILEKKDYGGTILHMLLQDIVANFNHNDYRDMTVLKLLILLENTLIREKVIDSDFAFLVASKLA
jgi:2-polyprenyl-3-methyl-5-hydroxy-6-metoxy-1,4-benzoquinol methylase